MTVRTANSGEIELLGVCGVDDAEALQQHLLASPRTPVEWAGCEQLHSAVIQILLIARPLIRGMPRSAFLRDHIAPLVRASAQ